MTQFFHFFVNLHSVDVIYFDFAKTIDSVRHLKLLHKLRAYGFCSDLLRILSNFLQDTASCGGNRRTSVSVLPHFFPLLAESLRVAS